MYEMPTSVYEMNLRVIEEIDSLIHSYESTVSIKIPKTLITI